MCVCARARARHFNRMNDDKCVFKVQILKFVLHIYGLFNNAVSSAVWCKVGGRC